MKVIIEQRAQAYDDSLYRASYVENEGHNGFELLGPKQIEEYREQGYLVLRNALDKQAVDSARFELENMAKNDKPNCQAVIPLDI
ncbi:MAG: hypothetical protein O3C43_21000 [Verrucomicrobia bacterium]|nr:hypothetical protein [Verrucomicrobiota bacterium]MDA1068972.1 hypothetical protein [Verrucomicrobiota bacterium]